MPLLKISLIEQLGNGLLKKTLFPHPAVYKANKAPNGEGELSRKKSPSVHKLSAAKSSYLHRRF